MCQRCNLCLLYFNPRSREGSDYRQIGTKLVKQKFQSTLPRGERRVPSIAILPPFRISIHAPARGATPKGATTATGLYISIHAPARGATQSPRSFLRCPRYFNPRSREGSDTEGKALVMLVVLFQSTLPRGERRLYCFSKSNSKQISIHAPARGATSIILSFLYAPIFQSTLPRGERPDSQHLFFRQIHISIHAPARGATKRFAIISASLSNFNPRSREGSDYDGQNVKKEEYISIHAPARGATNNADRIRNMSDISIHAPARGATHSMVFIKIYNLISIHAPARGATLVYDTWICPCCISIHAPARGATIQFPKIYKTYKISIHAPARGATANTHKQLI